MNILRRNKSICFGYGYLIPTLRRTQPYRLQLWRQSHTEQNVAREGPNKLHRGEKMND